MSSEYRVNKSTGQVVKDDGTGWKPVASVRNKTTGAILIDEGNGWQPLPGMQSAGKPDPEAGFKPIGNLNGLGRSDDLIRQAVRIPSSDLTQTPEELDAFDAQRRLEKERLRVPDSNFKERSIVALNVPTFGSGPRFAAGMQTLGALAATPFIEGDIIDREGISGATSQFLDEARIHQRRAREERPLESIGTEVGLGLLQGKTLIDTLGKKLIPQANTVANVGRVIGVGTGYGAAYAGSQNESGTLEGVAQDAAFGGTIGGISGGVLKGAEAPARVTYRAGKEAAATISDALSDLLGKAGGARDRVADEVAVAAVRRSMERSGMNINQIMDLVKKYEGKPAVLAEVIGQDAVNALTALTRRPGSTPQKAQDLIEERFYGRPDRMKGDVEDATGIPIGQLDDTLDAQLIERQQAAKPIYDALYKQYSTIKSFGESLKRINRLARTPAMQKHLKLAEEAVKTQAAIRQVPVSKMSKMEYWDLVKRSLDDEINSAVAKGEARTKVGASVADLTQLKSAITDEFDRLTGGAYAAAREAGGEAPRLRAAAQAGQKALQARNPRDVAKTVAATLSQDLPALRAGIVDDLGTRIDKGMTPGRVRVPDVAGKLRAGLGDEAANKLINRLDAEATLSETGSRWAPRMNSVTGTVMESGATQMGDDLVNAGMNLATGNKVGLARQAINFMRQRGFSQRQIDAIGDLLLSSPEEGLRRLRMLAPDGAPTNALAPVTGGPTGTLPPPAGAPPPNALAPRTAGLGTRAADATAIAAVASGGQTAQADTGGTAEADTGKTSPELKTANERVIGIEAQINKLNNETIPTLEEQIRLLQDYKADPKEKQRILIARGHKLGEYGPNRDGVDGVITPGSYSANAIVSEVAKIEADIAKRRQEREVYKGDLATARGELNKIEVKEAEQGGKPATPLRDKVLEAASYGAGIYLAHRFRKGGLNAAQKNATAIESKANALLSRRPPVPPVPDKTALGSIPLVGQPIEKALFPNKVARNTSATNAAVRAAQAAEPRLSGSAVPPISPNPTSLDGLPARVANLNKYYTDGGAERQLPFEDLGNGQFASRTDVMPDHRLYGPKGPIGRFMEPVTSRFRTGDVAVTAGGALDYTVMSGMVEQTRTDIKTAEEELKVARTKGDSIGITRAKKDIEKLETIESVQVAFQRLGLGMMGFGVLGGMHGKYARPQPRHEAATRERNLINQAISPAPIAPPPAPVVPPPLALVNALAPPPSPKKPGTVGKPKPKPPVTIGTSGRTKKPANDNN